MLLTDSVQKVVPGYFPVQKYNIGNSLLAAFWMETSKPAHPLVFETSGVSYVSSPPPMSPHTDTLAPTRPVACGAAVPCGKELNQQ